MTKSPSSRTSGTSAAKSAAVYYRLRPDEKVTSELPATLYRDGFCPLCRSARGARQREVKRRLIVPMRGDLAFVSQGLHLVDIVTLPLKKLLLGLGLEEANFAPVEDAAGRELAELCPSTKLVRWVALKDSIGIKANALRCPECQKEMFMFVHRVWGKGIFAYVSAEDAANIKNDAVIAGFEDSAEVLLRDSGYIRVLQEKILKKSELARVGIVSADEIEPNVVCREVTAGAS